MSAPSEAQRQAWMAQWRRAAVALELIRLDELLSVDLARIAADLDDVSVAAALARGQSTTSGLIAQQAILHRHRP
ncbi:MAG TPA: hypothetical protein PLL69_00180 [Gemmatimonadales bacterium]|nr:hypothetical protein [Gemmatimonadales bacterium]